MTGRLIDEIAQYLAAQGMGTYTDAGNGTLFIGFLPDSPDVAICIYETTGLPAETDIPLHLPSFQIIHRNSAISAGQTVAQSIRNLLHNQYNVQFVVNGTYVYSCNLAGEGGHIGQDDKGRDLFSLNFQCRVR